MHYYIITIQYLGFRYHGWAKQNDCKTVHETVDKTLRFVFEHANFKTLGSSRTDAMVSANEYLFELFVDKELIASNFLSVFNSNLPPDIRALCIKQTDESFNIIQSAKTKEYLYLFAFGKKFHPFCAPLMALFPHNIDIELMKIGAKLFEGTHNFRNYCTKPSKNGQFTRTIFVSEITENTIYTANFFPERSFIFRIQSSGFMRNQIRLMMAQLIELGKRNISLEILERSLEESNEIPFRNIAPASGLLLQKQWFDELQ